MCIKTMCFSINLISHPLSTINRDTSSTSTIITSGITPYMTVVI